MRKKITLEKLFKKIEKFAEKAKVLMQNRLVIAIFLIVDGITIVFNPNAPLTRIARSVILIIILSAISSLMSELYAKKKNIISIIKSLILLIVSVTTYLYPDFISAYMQLLLSIYIIYVGLSNILGILHLNRFTDFIDRLSKKYDNISNQKKLSRDIDKQMTLQGNKYIKPLQKLLNKAKNSSVIYIIVNILTIVLGILLLVSSFSMFVWGIIFLYTGISDLIIVVKAMNLSDDIKEKSKVKKGDLKNEE